MSERKLLNSNVMYRSYFDLSCGVGILGNVWAGKNPEDIFKDLYHSERAGLIHGARAFIIFSDADKKGYGIRLAEFIANIPEEYNINNIYEIGPRRNPNSGNDIRLWIWEFDFNGFKKFVEQLK